MKYHRLLVLAAAILMMVGCSEDEDIAYSFEANAYMRGMKIDGKVVYAPVLVTQSIGKTARMTALDENKNNYVLETYWKKNQNNYRWIPEVADYKTKDKFSSSMTFTFNAVAESSSSDDKKNERKVTVSINNVPQDFEITDLSYEKDKNQTKITWGNAKADVYIMQLSEKLDSYPIFQSINLTPTEDDAKRLTMTLNSSSLKWIGNASPQKGTTYLLSIHAYKLTGSTVTGEFLATKSFVWGK